MLEPKEPLRPMVWMNRVHLLKRAQPRGMKNFKGSVRRQATSCEGMASECLIVGPQDAFTIQYLDHIRARNDWWVLPKLVRRNIRNLDGHRAALGVNKFSQIVVNRRLEGDDRRTLPGKSRDREDIQWLHIRRCLFLDGDHTVRGRQELRQLIDGGRPDTHPQICDVAIGHIFKQQLDEHPGPFLLFMHHNPVPTHLGPMDQIRLLDDAAFRRLVGAHRDRIRHIFFGHCHLPLSGSVAGVPTSSLRGTNHASYPLFSETVMLSASDLPESYGVAFVGDNYVTVHMVEFGYDGPIRVEGSPDYNAWDRETMAR